MSEPRATKDLAPGVLVDGRYRVVRPLAEGGMGAVYEAEHVGLAKHIALKVLHADIADAPGVAARFEREARATSRLDHPRIVRVTDFGRSAQGLYLVMELLDGRSLGDLLEETGRLPAARAVAIADQVLDALGAAHAAGLVHRDLKPDNVFLCRAPAGEDRVKILDFGIAAARGDDPATKLTQLGAILGTPGYLAPEQAMGRTDIDGRVDLHAVGILLYEMISGQVPYEGENYNQLIHAILIGKPAPIESLQPDLAPAWSAVIRRALATAPNDRYADAAEMRAALAAKTPAATAATVEPAWRMPTSLSTTDLGGSKSAPAARAPTEPRMIALEPVEPIALDRPAPLPESIALDRPAPLAESTAPIPRVGRSLRWIVPVLAALGTVALGALLVAFHPWAPKRDVIVELERAPADAQLLLDGALITGRRLQLPISDEEHVLLIRRKREPVRTIRFASDRDQVLDLSDANTTPATPKR